LLDIVSLPVNPPEKEEEERKEECPAF